MTFNQWCAGKSFSSHGRIVLEQIWNALVGAGHKPREVVDMFNELTDNFRERRQ